MNVSDSQRMEVKGSENEIRSPLITRILLPFVSADARDFLSPLSLLSCHTDNRIIRIKQGERQRLTGNRTLDRGLRLSRTVPILSHASSANSLLILLMTEGEERRRRKLRGADTQDRCLGLGTTVPALCSSAIPSTAALAAHSNAILLLLHYTLSTVAILAYD